MSETRTYGGTWKSQRSRKQSAVMWKDTWQEWQHTQTDQLR